MKVLIRESFWRDYKKIKDKKLRKQVEKVILYLNSIKNFGEIKQIKRLNWYKNYYRIRIGDYRLGIQLKNWILIIERFLHRKDIYKFFP